MKTSLTFLCQVEKDPNMIKENYEEYIVEFSVTIVDPVYSRLLSDPEAPQYHDITQELTEKVWLYRPTAAIRILSELFALTFYKCDGKALL